MIKLTRRAAISAFAAAGILAGASVPAAAADIKFTLATSGSETDQRSVAMANVFAPTSSFFSKILLTFCPIFHKRRANLLFFYLYYLIKSSVIEN